jgi:peptidoglycan hydrolase-like protein with peptidoglycan-binding domain
MILRLRDSGDNVKQLQRNLNKIGSALLIDGDFGPGTRDAVIDARAALSLSAAAGPAIPAAAPIGPGDADDALIAALEALPEPFPPLGSPGVTFIARFEIGSPKQYRVKYRQPVWPGESSGITIGIGYDLRFCTRAQFEADWVGVPRASIDRLAPAFQAAGNATLCTSLADLDFPLELAMKVFTGRTLPSYLAQTRSIYPQVDSLPRARRSALVSLVYNRGTDLEGDRRREMKNIQTLLAAGNLEAVSAEFESMERLWPDAAGLVKRRHDEAKLWRSGFAALQLE